MTQFNCEITETLGDSWATPGTSVHQYSYEGTVNMDGYTDSMVDSTRSWKCKK